MNLVGYWVDRRGKIIKLSGSNHITQVIKDPKTFGVTKDYIEKTYESHGEKIGSEGEAREEIILKILERGFIRVRLYKSRWSITIHQINNMTKDTLSKWAEVEMKNKQTGQFFPVYINVAKTDKLIKVEEIRNVWYGVYEGIQSFKNYLKVNG